MSTFLRSRPWTCCCVYCLRGLVSLRQVRVRGSVIGLAAGLGDVGPLKPCWIPRANAVPTPHQVNYQLEKGVKQCYLGVLRP
jgi:hypothetical protein